MKNIFLAIILLMCSRIVNAQTYDLWNGKQPTVTTSSADGGPTVGFAVTAMVDGSITGIRWNKPAGSGGTRQAGIWESDTSLGFAGFAGNLARSGTFTNETASGWQTLTFTQPYPLSAGESVIVGVFYSSGSTVYDEANRSDATTYTNASNTLKIIADRAFFTATGSLAFPEVGMDDIPWVDVVFTTTGGGGGGGNQPPVANAGPDQNIVTPASSVTLNGSGTDPDGSISGYAWSKISGPGGETITSPSSASTTVTGLVEGTYVFRLTVTDNGGSSATDDVQVTVSATSTGNLSFTKIPFSSPDLRRPNSGLEFWIYQSLIRIPEAGSPADNETQRYDRWEWRAFETTQGVYNWALFDESINLAIDRGQTFAFAIMGACGGCSDFQVSVNGATNKTMPNYVVTGGGAWNYGGVWYPNWNSSVYKNALRNFHNALAQHILNGSYNGVPYRNVIKYIDIRGVGEYDEWHFYDMLDQAEANGYKPTVASYKEITDIFTTAYNDFQLVLLSDGLDPSGWSNTPAEIIHYILTRSTKVGPVGWRRDNWGHNQPWYSAKLENNPAVWQGIQLSSLIMDRWKTSPIVGEPLQCCTIDNGSTLYYDLPRQASFYHLSNLGNGNLENSGDANTISNMRLASKTMGYRITLNGGSMPDVIPKGTPWSLSMTWANEGVAPPYDPWHVIYQLRNTSNGNVVWQDTSGFKLENFLPGTSTYVDNFTVPTSVSDGTYHLYLIVKDSMGYMINMPLFLSSPAAETGNVYRIRSNVSLSSSGVNINPTVNAGPDQAIQLPTSTTTLSGSASDPDGTIATYAWTKVSGPSGGTIQSPSAASTGITGLVAGAYVFRLTVVDNGGATAFDDISVVVVAENSSPSANAGVDQSITLPVSSVTLSGSGSDPDGTIVSYLWTKISGSGGSIVSPASATTVVSSLSAGTYVFRLTVTDNSGSTASDDVQVVVNQATVNIPPSANAGADSIVYLPRTEVTLIGSGSDADGTVSSYTWTKVSGPAGSGFVSPSAATTKVTGLVSGAYVFRLTVTDNQGATAADDVLVTVTSTTALNAGVDRSTSSGKVTLSATVPSGTTAVVWSKVSAPVGDTSVIENPNQQSTRVTGMSIGTYVFRVTATVNGSPITDDVTIVSRPNKNNRVRSVSGNQ